MKEYREDNGTYLEGHHPSYKGSMRSPVWRCIWGRPRFRVWSQGVRKLWWGDNERVCPLNVLGIGPSHKKRRSLSASQTWACSRIAAITKWACAASDVCQWRSCSCAGKGGSRPREGSGCFGRELPRAPRQPINPIPH